MPRRAHGRPILQAGPSKPIKRKPRRNAILNALETAERQNLDPVRVRQHRLGEVEDESETSVTRDGADERSTKRRKITNADGDNHDEDVEEGSDLEGGRWHTGINEDDEDSDLDSDDAFGESDEERFADFTFRGSNATRQGSSTAQRNKTRRLDLDEDADTDGNDDGEQEDDLGDEAIDLATAWDMDDDDQKKKHQIKVRLQDNSTDQSEGRSDTQSTGRGSSGDSDISESESEDNESRFSLSDDELDGDTTALRSFVEGLSSSRADLGRDQQAASRETVGSRKAAMPVASTLSAADLLQYVTDPTQRQSIKILQSAERSGPREYAGGIPGKLSAPLAKRQQDRVDRAAAYDKSKETLNRWIDTVRQNRRAEHLSFPLVDDAKASAIGQKQLVPLSQSAPLTALEKTIDQIMRENGAETASRPVIQDGDQAYEGLVEKKADIEDIRTRRAELRIARELMFREEIRAKRIKKIKSKAFRRVHRKERGKIEAQQREALAAAGLLDSDNEREKNDRRRAEERMGARHRESKWAKEVKQTGRAAWDEDARTGVTNAIRRDEELRRRISGKNMEGSDISDVETDSDSDNGFDSGNERMANKLDALQKSTTSESKSKLSQMAFMQRAEAAQKAKNDDEIRQLLTTVEGGAGNPSDGEDEYKELKGRQKFGGRNLELKGTRATSKATNEFEAQFSGDEAENEHEIGQVRPNEVQGRTSSSKAPGRHDSVGTVAGKKDSLVRPQSNPALKSTKELSGVARQYAGAETALDGYTSPSESGDDVAYEASMQEAKASLAASIFAGPDDVVQEFEQEKKDIVEEEGDQVVDNTLPGWGSWAGAGVSKREQKKGKGRFLTKVQGVAPDRRQDARLERVVINEKRVKKNGKYLAVELPHPFETVQQYERSLRLPVGPEWSTANHYQDSIKPRVLVKQGSVIRPIAKPVA